jgi:hypothetical protein
MKRRILPREPPSELSFQHDLPLRLLSFSLDQGLERLKRVTFKMV